MLIKFNFKNFKSFKDENCLDMQATNIKEHSYNIIHTEDNDYLKIAAIYGANASGKTNVLEAFRHMKRNIISTFDSTTKWSNLLKYYNFIFDKEHAEDPIELEVTIKPKECDIYQYGFAIKENVIKSEWLYKTKGKKNYQIFEREEEKIKFGNKYKYIKGNYQININNLFLPLYTKIDQQNKDFLNVYNWFLNTYYLDLGDPGEEIFMDISERIREKEYREKLVKFVKYSDPTIIDIEIKSRDEREIDWLYQDNLEINFIHKTKDVKETLPFSLESKGTTKMFYLYNLITSSLEKGSCILIDELDAKLHPLLTRYIINMFHNPETNKNNGQLIYSTHDTTNLNKETFRRDEIWFTEKNDKGVSELYSLSDYKIENTKIRNDATYNKDYLTGRYGAIPVLEEFDTK